MTSFKMADVKYHSTCSHVQNAIGALNSKLNTATVTHRKPWADGEDGELWWLAHQTVRDLRVSIWIMLTNQQNLIRNYETVDSPWNFEANIYNLVNILSADDLAPICSSGDHYIIVVNVCGLHSYDLKHVLH